MVCHCLSSKDGGGGVRPAVEVEFVVPGKKPEPLPAPALATAIRAAAAAPRRFPPPWSVEETDACFIVRDANGQALACVYFEDARAARSRS
jgi:hypothetical protein